MSGIPSAAASSSEPFLHFQLHLFAAISRLLAQAASLLGSEEELLRRFPFLEGYREELERLSPGSLEHGWQEQDWAEALEAWEEGHAGHLPLRALRGVAPLELDSLTLLLEVGLVEEDARFGLLFAALQGTPTLHRPTAGLLNAWGLAEEDRGEVRLRLRRLVELGLLGVLNPEAPRSEQALHVPGPVWDALRGESHEQLAPGLSYHSQEALRGGETLVLPEALRQEWERLPALLRAGEVQALVVRGPQHNGRRTLLRAVARELGRGVLEVEEAVALDPARWRPVGVLATLLHALPVVVLTPGPGETVELARLEGTEAPLGVVLGHQGGVSGPAMERSLVLHLPMPGPEERREHWRRALEHLEPAALETLAERFRMTSGHLRRAATLARTHAVLAGRGSVQPEDVRAASRSLHRQALEALAVRLEPAGDWTLLAVGAETLRELRHLEARCRHRERLAARLGAAFQRQLTPGVRALFQGSSGTGKTLAARLLGSALGLDVYRVQLSSVVNKYIGETEKNLERLFALAEELDVLLLFDEGDALFARRTGVGSSNDRYANLETNYLLQRVETFEGVLVVTTNAVEAIDTAFQRRMDVVVGFRAPEAGERWAIWRMHLPEEHAVEASLLGEVATRCDLSGGQIRNAVLYASLLAAEDGQVLGSAHLEAGVAREYRKAGMIYPLRRTGTASLRS